ncbi:alpha-crystallin A chain-like [Mizuhopecten yessoensis]|uniref:Alpha-crystallin B chain n=1 Tax=Mizuhopecten yessoensis TaxID=6573 RepID=A0A210R6F5_MIZYE|nr:alpha-crystallin A chain-like [Mizuhopecten yessoensis]OWF56592.1 Alpha-crystallin B chain [Mizuhopecten yessoensis]
MDLLKSDFFDNNFPEMSSMDKEFGTMGSSVTSMSSTTTMKSSNSKFDSGMGNLGACDSLMGAGIGGGRLVPTRFFDWNFFDRQKSMFSDISTEFDNDFGKFDMELESMRKSMFRFDGDPVLKVEQPYVESRSGSKKLSLTFDVSGYKPENIHIKTVDSMLTVHAKHEEKTAETSVYREFTKSYTLPKAVDPLALTSSLSADGVLSIEAPAPREVVAKKERFVPIELLKPL